MPLRPTDPQDPLASIESWNRRRRNGESISFARANLRGRYLVGGDFSAIDFSGADMSGTVLEGLPPGDHPAAEEVILYRVCPSSQRLVEFRRYLHAAILRRALLVATQLAAARLAGADLFQATMDRVSLLDADLTGCNITGVSCRHADLRGATLAHANLSFADLRRSDCRGADFTGASLRHANLEGVDLSGARLVDADFSHANLLSTKLDGAVLLGAVFEPTLLQPPFPSAHTLVCGDPLEIAPGNWSPASDVLARNHYTGPSLNTVLGMLIEHERELGAFAQLLAALISGVQHLAANSQPDEALEAAVTEMQEFKDFEQALRSGATRACVKAAADVLELVPLLKPALQLLSP